MLGSRVGFDPDTFSIIRDCHKLTFSMLTAVYNSYGQNGASRIVLADYASRKGLWFVGRKVETERQAAGVDLLIGTVTCVVQVLVIWIQLQMLGQWQ